MLFAVSIQLIGQFLARPGFLNRLTFKELGGTEQKMRFVEEHGQPRPAPGTGLAAGTGKKSGPCSGSTGLLEPLGRGDHRTVSRDRFPAAPAEHLDKRARRRAGRGSVRDDAESIFTRVPQRHFTHSAEDSSMATAPALQQIKDLRERIDNLRRYL
jgi:hypothetical protein